MIQRLGRNPIALAFIAIALLIVVGSTFAIVPETKQAVVVRFGEPQRIINRFKPEQEFGQTGAGLAARIPFVEQIVWIDKRILSVEMDQQQVLSTDQLRRSEEHTSELQSLMRLSYAVFCLKNKIKTHCRETDII